MAILVTDDELVAASVRYGRVWDGLLPSLDLAQEGTILSAVARGYRSLGVRGLMDDDGFTEPALELGRFAAGEVVIRGFTAASDTPMVPIGPGFALVVSGDELSFDLTGAEGIHDITPMTSADEAWRAVHNVLVVVADRGLGADRVFTVLANGAEPGTGIAIVAAEGTVSDCDVTFDTDGRPVVTPALTGTLDDAERRVESVWLLRSGTVVAS